MLNGMKSLSLLSLALALNVTTSVTAWSTSTWTAQSRREPAFVFARNNIYANAQGGKRRQGGMGTTALMDTESEERPPLYVENSAADVTNRKLSLDETNAGFACPLGADETRVASDVPTLALDPKSLSSCQDVILFPWTKTTREKSRSVPLPILTLPGTQQSR